MKKIVLIILSLLLLTGCVNKESQKNTNKIASDVTSKETKQEVITEQTPVEETIEEPIVYVRDTTDSSTNADVTIMNYVNDLEAEVTNITNTEDLTSTAKTKLKQSFITLTDFVFYEGEINGITFKELSTTAKEKVLDIYNSIDNKIENIWPNYKETIKTTSKKIYTNVKEKTIELKEEIKNKYKDAIGEEAYNNSVQIFEEDITRLKEGTAPTIDYVKEKSKETYESIKESASNWYQKFKESSE